MATNFGDYLKEAFHAKPWGMFIAPNWVLLAGIGMAAFVDPAFLILGAGVELGYLFLLASNSRFQRLVQGKKLLETQRAWTGRQQVQMATLSPKDQERYKVLEARCRGILDLQKNLDTSPVDLKAQGEGLAKLTWIYLRLLLTRQGINKVMAAPGSDSTDNLKERVKQLSAQVKDPAVSEDLRKSLSGQVEILEQRIAKQKEGKEKLAFLDAELMRIEEQVELIREQAAVSADPKSVSERIDFVAADLTGRSQWLRDQQALYGKVEDLLSEPPPADILGVKSAEKA